MKALEILEKFSSLQVGVLGDVMLDEYVWGQATRVSPESPVLVIHVTSENSVPGGAANVAANVTSLGANAQVFGVIGNDAKSQELIESMSNMGIGSKGLILDASRPTTRKTRVLAQSQQVLRVDRESVQELSDSTASQLIEKMHLLKPSMDTLLISDYSKGVVSEKVVPEVISEFREAGVFIAANGKPQNAHVFSGAHVLTFNFAEACEIFGKSLGSDLMSNGTILRKQLGVDTLVITRGAEGMSFWTSQIPGQSVPAHKVDVYDVAGAGDTSMATFALAMSCGAEPLLAAEMAMFAAGIVVSKVGVARIQSQDLKDALVRGAIH